MFYTHSLQLSTRARRPLKTRVNPAALSSHPALLDCGVDTDTRPAGWRLRNDVIVTRCATTAPLRSCRVGQRKVKKTPCNSLFKRDLIRPTLALGKHVLTCTDRTDLVIHGPHRPEGASHLIRVRSMVQIHLGPLDVSLDRTAFISTTTRSRRPGWLSNARKTQRRLPLLSVPGLFEWTDAPIVSAVQLRPRARPPGLGTGARKGCGRSDARVPMRRMTWRGSAPSLTMNAERMAKLMKRERCALEATPAARVAGVQNRPQKLSPRRIEPFGAGKPTSHWSVSPLKYQGLSQKLRDLQ
jgi:hypothetical protein